MVTKRGKALLRDPERKDGKERKLFVPKEEKGRGKGRGRGGGKGRGERKRSRGKQQGASQSQNILVITGNLKTGPDFNEPLCFPPMILGDKFSATLLEA